MRLILCRFQFNIMLFCLNRLFFVLRFYSGGVIRQLDPVAFVQHYAYCVMYTRSVYLGKSSAVFAVKRKRCRLVKYKFDVFAMSYCDKAVVLDIFTHH